MSARRERKSAYPMISVDEALLTVLKQTSPLPPKKVPLLDAVGCVLAESVVAPEPQPGFAASIMDGYAALASDGPGTYPVVGVIRAGTDPEKEGIVVKPGTVAYITTGAKMPAGADTVIKVEDTEDGELDAASGQERSVRVVAGAVAGQWIRAVGSDVAQGQTLLHKGATVGPAEVGLLASVGVSAVSVVARPRVGVLSTGDEIYDHDDSKKGAAQDDAKGGRIRDSNRPCLLALYASSLGLGGGGVVDLGIVSDKQGVAGLTAAIRQAFDTHGCDVVVTSGGVSMGDADLLKPALLQMGTVHFGRLNMKPGKPTTFATVPSPSGGGPSKLVFALPGNPVSCLVCSHLLVSPALRRLQGLPPQHCMLPQVVVRLGSAVVLDPERPEYQRVTLTYDTHTKSFVGVSTGGQRSSRLLSMAAANALICLPAGQGTLPVGTEVPALLVVGPLPSPAPAQSVHPQAASHLLPPPDTTSSSSGQGPAVFEGCPCCKPNTDTTTAAPATTGGSAPAAPGSAAFSGVIRVALVTVSDRAHSGSYEDKSGPAMAAILTGPSFRESTGLSVTVAGSSVVPDEVAAIQAAVKHWTDTAKVDLVLTSGGTGFAPRDVTPEAVRPLLTKEAPGLVFRIMQVGTSYTPLAVISRPVAGVRGSTLVVTLPGSPKAVKENLDTLTPLLPKILSLLQTATCDHKDMATTLTSGK